MKIITNLVASAFFLAMASSSTHAAEPAVGDRFGDWTFECQAVSANVNKCALTQTLLATGSNGRILRLTLGKLGSQGELALLALTPLGIYLPAGVAGKVDQGKQFPLIVQKCTQNGCEAAVQVDDDLLSLMKAGKSLMIAFMTGPGGETITVPASLKGLSTGLKALGL